MNKSILQQINHWAACARLTSECSSVVHADLLEKVASHIISIESLQEETQKERDDAQRDRDLHYRVSEKFRIELIASEAALSAANEKLSKPVVLPVGYAVRAGHPINEGERNVMIPKEGGRWLSRLDVEHAIRVAGFTVKEGATPIVIVPAPAGVIMRPQSENPLERCAAGRDGECHHKGCPQLRDNEPMATGRHCPIDNWDDE